MKTLKAMIDMNPLDDPISEANIAYLEDALKHINHNTASNEVEITRNRAQFKATQVKDKLSRSYRQGHIRRPKKIFFFLNI